MAKHKHGASRGPSRSDDPDAQQDPEEGSGGTDGFIGRLGLLETGSGLPHGPAAIVLAIAAALVIYPISRLIRFVARR
jgi:hypothetical protein